MSDVSHREKKLAIAVMEQSFDGNPAVHYSIGNTQSPFYIARRKALASFMYRFCKRRNGVFISPNENGVICFYHSSAKGSFIYDFFDEIKLALFAVGPIRLFPVVFRANAVSRIRKRQGEHLHCWYLGVREGSRDFKTAAWLRDTLYEKAHELNLPVCAETTMLQNKKVYERMGFITYEQVKSFGLTTYCMIYFPTQFKKTT